MKSQKLVTLITVVLCMLFSVTAYSAISVTASPKTAPAKTDIIIFSTYASSEGEAVQVELLADSNNNGIIDNNEWPFIKKIIIDNSYGGDNIISGDNDPASVNISASLNIQNGIFPAGVYTVRVRNELGDTAIDQFTLTPVSENQTVSGKIYELDSNNPVPGAIVYCSNNSTGTFIAADYTDNNGNYILQIPSPGDISIGAFKSPFIEPSKKLISVSSQGVSNYNIYLRKSDAEITGTITESGTGKPVWGVEVRADTIENAGADGFTDVNGKFTLYLTSYEEWSIGAGDRPGYFGINIPLNNYEDDINIYPVQLPGTNVIDFTAHRETSWIDGKVADEYGSQFVEGVLLYAFRTNTNNPELRRLANGYYSDSSGQVTLGLEPGDWRVGVCLNCHDHPVKINGDAKELVPQQDITVESLGAGERRKVILKTYYGDSAIEGRVFRQDCQTPAPDDVRVIASSNDAKNGPSQTSVGYIRADTDTDGSGNYRLPLLGGTWSVKAEMYDWNRESPVQIITLVTDGNDRIDKPGETRSGVDLCLNIPINIEVIKASVFTETFANHPWGREDGWYLHLKADVYDPSENPGNVNVVARNVDGTDPNVYTLDHSKDMTFKVHPPYTDSSRQKGIYRFTVTNKQEQYAYLDAKPVDLPRKLDVIQDLAVSDNSTTPTFTFGTVQNADKYRLTVFNASHDTIYKSDLSNTTSFDIPLGALTECSTYYLRAEAWDINAEDKDGVDDLENRSVNHLRFSPCGNSLFSIIRDLPDYVAPGSEITMDIDIDVDEGNAPNGLIVNEYIPAGWTLVSTSPKHEAYDQISGKISWLFFGKVSDTTISYTVLVSDYETPGEEVCFNGEAAYNDPSGDPVEPQTGGDQCLTIGSPFNQYDTNQDCIIDDFELLDTIDAWAAGTLGDFELLDLIDFWAKGSYC